MIKIWSYIKEKNIFSNLNILINLVIFWLGVLEVKIFNIVSENSFTTDDIPLIIEIKSFFIIYLSKINYYIMTFIISYFYFVIILEKVWNKSWLLKSYFFMT